MKHHRFALACLVAVCILQPGALHAAGITISGDASGELYLLEEENRVTFGNADIEFVFDTAQGGALVQIVDKNSTTTFTFPGQHINGQWSIEITPASAFPNYEGGECSFDENEAVLRLQSSHADGQLTHIYRLKKGAKYLILESIFSNKTDHPVFLGNFRYTLANLAIGESIEDNQYIYPPTWLHFMKGNIADATPDEMNARYIYGYSQSTDKMMLPYAMIFNQASRDTLAMAAVNSRAKVFTGAFGGEAGTLDCRFDHFRMVQPEENIAAGTVYLSALQGGWQQAMQDEKDILIKEAGFRAPAGLPAFVKDLVIVWHGIPGVNVHNYHNLGEKLKNLSDAGVNAVIVGGKLWHCPASGNGEGTIFDYIPIPRDGWVVPAADTGGLDGLKELMNTAHALGMKLFTWGPVSMAGIAREAAEAASKPDWWIHKENGEFNDWYHFMAPANPHSEGWRNFFLNNIEKIVRDYGVDGFWLDSSWQDHQRNYQAADGWQGAPNGAKLELVDQIVAAAKTINPDCVVMAEASGAEFMSRVDIAYLQVHGIWPAVPPEGIQEMLIAQEINRIPRVRPFGQIELGAGFYPELKDENARRIAQDYADSWIAKTFLTSTLDRIPVYFGLSWDIDLLFLPDANNPNREKFQRWFDMVARINKVRSENREIIDGETIFGAIETSSPSVVNYLRKEGENVSIIVLNAEKTEQAVTVKISKPEILNIERGKKCTITNLMNGEKQEAAALPDTGFPLTLAGYEGAVLKITPCE